MLVATKLDRLRRNAMDIRTTVEHHMSIDVRVHCMALGGVDLASAAGKMTMSVLGTIAEFERYLLIARAGGSCACPRRENDDGPPLRT